MLVVVDGVFSMEGDVAPLVDITELCARHGARLMVDEAHGAGVLGARGAGASELLGVEDRVDLRMGTFSKSLAACGGFVAGPAEVIEYLRISSRAVPVHRLGGPGRARRRARGAAHRPLRRGPGAARSGARARPLSRRRAAAGSATARSPARPCGRGPGRTRRARRSPRRSSRCSSATTGRRRCCGARCMTAACSPTARCTPRCRRAERCCARA